MQGVKELVSRKRSKLDRDSKEVEEQTVDLSHDLREELTDSLVLMSKRFAEDSRRQFQGSLDRAAAEREKNQKVRKEKKLVAAEGTLIQNFYLLQQ